MTQIRFEIQKDLLQVARVGTMSFSDDTKAKIVDLIVSKNSLDGGEQLKTNIHGAIKGLPHILYRII